MDITQLIGNLGFPIACVIGMGYFVNGLVNRTNDDFKAREERYLENNAKLAQALNTASETQKLIFQRMDCIEDKVVDIDNKVDQLIHKE